jgi:Fic family protein
MAENLRRRWDPRFVGSTRHDRHGCTYDAYLPDPLSGWTLTLPSDLAADVADAETAIRDLNQAGTSHVCLEGLARFLLRAESVASSRIEGLDAGPRRLVEAEAIIARGDEPADRVAVEVLGNIASMESAIQLGAPKQTISLTDLLGVHRVLLDRSPTPELGGMIRDQQNWIGGSAYNPCSAVFVPPPPEQVEGLLHDLIDYHNGDQHSPLVQAAIAHAQFETIHPFADGNGRTGRALIHVILRRRGLSPTFVPPISLVLATWSNDYIAGLTAFRHLHPADSPERSTATHTWLRTFTAATLRACSDAQAYASRIDALVGKWRSSLGTVRKGSALGLLVDVLPGAPLMTVESAAGHINRSTVAAAGAIDRLLDTGILTQRNVGKKRYRIFEAPDVLQLFASLERSLASPTGDTAMRPPLRPVPRR